MNPITTGFAYSESGERPGRLPKFDNLYGKPTETYKEFRSKGNVGNDDVISKVNPTNCQVNRSASMKNKSAVLLPSHKEEIPKAKTKCLQQNEEEDAGTSDINSKKDTHPEFLNRVKEIFSLDDEDIRTDARNTYNGWPYSYHGPYSYEIKKTNREKAKDKRFFGAESAIIPVHENVEDNIPIIPNTKSASSKHPITDNPIYGDQPFFSFILNDYFDRPHEEDPLVFKEWGEEFDNEISSKDMDDSERPSRRSRDGNYPNKIIDKETTQKYIKTTGIESATENLYGSNRGYERNQNERNNHHQESDNNYKGQRQTAFKDFANSFANKFGSEEHNKNSKFMLNQNQDKGEKRKGFRRVYHKDEYQEDNEFYDNTNKSAKSAESGGLSTNGGASHTILQSQAIGSDGIEGNSMSRKKNKNDKSFKNIHKGNENNKGEDVFMNRYRNIAKDTALSNNADYVDHY